MPALILGIEIGGTKLQFGLGHGVDPTFVEFRRRDIDRTRGAEGIRDQILAETTEILSRHDVAAIGYGFGGPVNHKTGQVVTSHQVDGWTDFPLRDWTESETGLPAVLANDCDSAALAEATFGAGQGQRTVFYVTVGTGIGGGLVIGGQLHGTDRPAVAEIGHLRPGLDCESPSQTVEAIASGLGLEHHARQIAEKGGDGAGQLLSMCDGDLQLITGQLIAIAAEDNNPIARQVLRSATDTLGWAVAQMVTLIAPDIVVIGGGVPMMPDALFLEPLRAAVSRYSFGPLEGSFSIVAASLGESVVVHGAILNAARVIDGRC